MSRNKHQDVRIRVLDQCFRNRSRKYTIDDLVDACNDAIGDIYGGGISTEQSEMTLNLCVIVKDIMRQ